MYLVYISFLFKLLFPTRTISLFFNIYVFVLSGSWFPIVVITSYAYIFVFLACNALLFLNTHYTALEDDEGNKQKKNAHPKSLFFAMFCLYFPDKDKLHIYINYITGESLLSSARAS